MLTKISWMRCILDESGRKCRNTSEGWKDELTCVNGHIPRCLTSRRWLTIPLLTGPDVEQLRWSRPTHYHHAMRTRYVITLKTGFNEFPLLKTMCIKGYSYAWVINIKKKNTCARLIDDFDAEKYCDRNCREPTWQCRKAAVTSLGRYSWVSAVFGIWSSLLENPPAG